ncbi:PP2C family protein-serine/threonine phosphatase [Mycobacterium sp. SMC-4]|uniref:PP2C family protein-serine/threonine phosphatase n=1 Tax=Mycobacterium sp. SMC-4 TaxID=2857059 RepID=UPI0021B2BDDF|nr:GAF domain-containing SpoIIE family protein phosphatase [Mycobacterium sp. SMC-4]UXA20378.1 SpoIIE family protein phosphatase [Mycobacterium sp. SMC-4]
MTAQPVEAPCTVPAELEEERLRAVDQLHLLGTPPEERFAQITRMARCVFDVPMAAVSLMDRDRQWFKQSDGLDLDGSVPRAQTVCQATIVRGYEHPEDPALILEDTWESAFCELPAISGAGGIRFYAGYPLYGPGGHPVGTFCIYDIKPRELSAAQREAFVELAMWAQRELQSADDLARAATVQRQLLPPALGDLPGYRVCALCLPAFAVGGDFYDHYPVQDGMIFTVADVMGKGLGAAILTATVRSALRGATRAVDQAGSVDLAEAVNTTYVQIVDDLNSTESFVTLFHLKLRTSDGTVHYVDAGHGFAAVIRRDGSVEPSNSDGLPLGVLSDDRWTAQKVQLEPGDTLVVASDGVLDLVSDGDDIDAAVRFMARYADPEELCAQARRLQARRPPLDDVTLVAIRRESA